MSLPFVEVTIGYRTQVKAVIKTAAHATFVRRSCLPPEAQITPTTARFGTLMGGRLKLVGEYRTEIRIGDVIIPHTLFVAKSLIHEMILGADIVLVQALMFMGSSDGKPSGKLLFEVEVPFEFEDVDYATSSYIQRVA